jgi:hypothetical protein
MNRGWKVACFDCPLQRHSVVEESALDKIGISENGETIGLFFAHENALEQLLS